MGRGIAADGVVIEGGLRRLGRSHAVDLLRPPLAPEVVRRSLSAAGVKNLATLESVYGWHDGADTSPPVTLDDLHLFPGFYLLSLGDALANYRAFVRSDRWNSAWLPLFANGGGDFYAVDLEAATSGAVRHFRIDEAEHPIEFASLDDMFHTLAAGFERGVFFVDDQGYLEMDEFSFGELAAELNPGVAWWRT